MLAGHTPNIDCFAGVPNRIFMCYSSIYRPPMNPLKVLLEMVDGFRDGGVEEALSEGVEETAEQALDREL